MHDGSFVIMHYGSVVEYDDAYVEYNTCYICNCVMVFVVYAHAHHAYYIVQLPVRHILSFTI